jgi:hypothetical protein
VHDAKIGCEGGSTSALFLCHARGVGFDPMSSVGANFFPHSISFCSINVLEFKSCMHALIAHEV